MPKLWLILFFGYNGSSFSGMQFQLQNHVLTIQDLLAEKLHSAGFLATNHHSQLQKQERWSRAARTDKGVHAVVNAVSCLFVVDKNYFDEDNILNRNKLHLDLKQLFQDTQIVFHGFRRVTTRFQVRHVIRSRHYCYVCPIYLFQAIIKKESLQKNQSSIKVDESSKEKSLGKEQDENNEVAEQKNENTALAEQKILDKINECCKQFIGTHNFHNYSKNLRAKDAQAQRYILNFQASKLDEKSLIFDIIGQSFIYHQIRKMIGCIIMVILNNYPANYIANTFFRNQIFMPLAPPQGLYLNQLSFQTYNKKKDIPEKLQLQHIQTIEKLKGQINEFITSRDDSEWKEWIQKLRESIYHGIEYVQDEKQPEGKVQQD